MFAYSPLIHRFRDAISLMSIPTILAAFFCLSLPGAAPGQTDEETDYVALLNENILSVSEEGRAYKVYFDAYLLIDSMNPGAMAASERLLPDRSGYQNAIAWAGQPKQQEAIGMILKRAGDDETGPNATERKLFGLPYGEENIPQDMADYEFAVYIDDGKLRFVDFAYLSRYEELVALMNAEMHRRASDGDIGGAIEAGVAMVHMNRQLCDRLYYEEKVRGFDMLYESCVRIRELIWTYRDEVAFQDIEHLEQLCRELEWLDLLNIKFPKAEKLLVRQLIDKIFRTKETGDYYPDEEKFPMMMSTFESDEMPLKRFESAAKWVHLAKRGQHATRYETEAALEDAIGNWRLRWRLWPHDSMLRDVTSEYEDLDPVKYTVVKMPLKKLAHLFELRIPLFAQINGTACAAGMLAYTVREGGSLVPGEIADAPTIPMVLRQIQPAYVSAEHMLVDFFDPNENQLHYNVVKNPDIRIVTRGYDIRTPRGTVHIPENWPLLYSIGFDQGDDLGRKHTPDGSEGDLIFWPVVDLMPLK